MATYTLELRSHREDLVSRKVDLQKKSHGPASIFRILTRSMNDYIRDIQVRLRRKKIGYKKEFLRVLERSKSPWK